MKRAELTRRINMIIGIIRLGSAIQSGVWPPSDGGSQCILLLISDQDRERNHNFIPGVIGLDERRSETLQDFPSMFVTT